MPRQVKLVEKTELLDEGCKDDRLKVLDELFAGYHRRMWYYRWMYGSSKRKNMFFNGLALLTIALGMMVGVFVEKSVAVVALTAFGTLTKGWMEFRKFSNTMDMCRLAYTTFEKLIAEIQKYANGLPLDDLDGFMIKCQTHEETVCDLTPPITEHHIQRYETQFQHVPVDISDPPRDQSPISNHEVP